MVPFWASPDEAELSARVFGWLTWSLLVERRASPQTKWELSAVLGLAPEIRWCRGGGDAVIRFRWFFQSGSHGWKFCGAGPSWTLGKAEVSKPRSRAWVERTRLASARMSGSGRSEAWPPQDLELVPRSGVRPSAPVECCTAQTGAWKTLHLATGKHSVDELWFRTTLQANMT